MPVEVFFRGPMLFLTHVDTVRSILVPDADKTENSYPDGTPAARHFARLFLRQGEQKGPTISYRGMDVLLDDGSRAACARDASMNHIISMDQLLPNETAVAKNHELVSSTIDIVGGRLSSELDSMNRYTLPTTFNPRALAPAKVRLICRWSTPAASVSLTFTSRDTEEVTKLTLTGNEQAYIYNFDREHMNAHDFRKRQTECTGTDLKEDIDFKWNFHMLREPKGGWKTCVPLPTPAYACSQAKTGENVLSPDSGDCLAATKEI